jgi:hypothetical protein
VEKLCRGRLEEAVQRANCLTPPAALSTAVPVYAALVPA